MNLPQKCKNMVGRIQCLPMDLPWLYDFPPETLNWRAVLKDSHMADVQRLELRVRAQINTAELEPLGRCKTNGAQHDESNPGPELRKALFGPAVIHHYPFTQESL